ncbi:hypothetical protein [Cupriavidus gilardii]|nr:hypothetical protein [Cupriavidus gilardii]MCT9016025.1 hypothetical protein [Cupriavidus gilardii]MCT9055795.1 hypothetical protein [Cupriavidus gilardii]MCT9125218.1 hypothetical protein [Cupriavidus gilardii]UXC35495.1 hypothetical protein N4G38_14045 [Cupriavidus gilardii]WNG69952.1 hypothetical protein QWJ31_23225 [Cupriavidus gilardii]
MNPEAGGWTKRSENKSQEDDDGNAIADAPQDRASYVQWLS